MSGILKSIGKVFKKVAKVVIKIAPYILMASVASLRSSGARSSDAKGA